MKAIKYILFYAYVVCAFLLIANVFGEAGRSVWEVWQKTDFFPSLVQKSADTNEATHSFSTSRSNKRTRRY